MTPNSAKKRKLIDVLDDPDHTDFKIGCVDREWGVSRSIVCSQSGFFHGAMTQELLEKKSGVFDLDDDDPEAVKHMLDFLYDSRESLTSRPQGSKESITESLNKRVRAYVVADKYLVDNMKEMLWEPMIAHLKYLMKEHPGGFLSAWNHILDLPAVPLAGLRAIAADLVEQNISSLWKLDGFSNTAAKDGYVAAKVLMLVLESSQAVVQAFRPKEIYRCKASSCKTTFGFSDLVRPEFTTDRIYCPMCQRHAKQIEADWDLRFTRSLRLSCSYDGCEAADHVVLCNSTHPKDERKSGTCIFCGIIPERLKFCFEDSDN